MTQWNISKMATAKKVGGINECEVNSISAGDTDIYIQHMLNSFKMDFKMIRYAIMCFLRASNL